MNSSTSTKCFVTFFFMYSNLTFEFYASICKKERKKRLTIQPFFFMCLWLLTQLCPWCSVGTVGCLVSEFVLILYVTVWIVKGHHGSRNMEVNGL